MNYHTMNETQPTPVPFSAASNFEVPVVVPASAAPAEQSGHTIEPTVEPIVELFGMRINPIRMPQAVARIHEWIAQRSTPCRFVVTPNVDHVVMFAERADLREVYEDASLVLADGTPVVLAAKLLGRPVPERVAGSDLAPALFDAATPKQPLRVYLLGAAAGVAEQAAENIATRWDHVEVVGLYSPPLGFEHDEAENARILEKVNALHADVLVVGLGAPKQELWIHRHHQQLTVPVALCIGATIDFLAGEKRRAPRWMQRTGLEWLHRVATEPRRLFMRYARDAWRFPPIVWRQWKLQQSGK